MAELPGGPTFRLGRALLNEVFYLSPRQALTELTVPVLLVHGTRDTFVPVGSSRQTAGQITRAQARLIEIDGAQHGFAVHDDPPPSSRLSSGIHSSPSRR